MRESFVYILFNHSRTLYVGVTNDLIRRIDEHRSGRVQGFTAKYRIRQLAYYEAYPTMMAAIEREKQVKGWTRAKKIALIEAENPHWGDLGNGLKERLPGALARADRVEIRSEILRCAQDDVSGEGAGDACPSQVLRSAQDDGSGTGDGVRGQVLRCAQHDGQLRNFET